MTSITHNLRNYINFIKWFPVPPKFVSKFYFTLFLFSATVLSLLSFRYITLYSNLYVSRFLFPSFLLLSLHSSLLFVFSLTYFSIFIIISYSSCRFSLLYFFLNGIPCPTKNYVQVSLHALSSNLFWFYFFFHFVPTSILSLPNIKFFVFCSCALTLSSFQIISTYPVDLIGLSLLLLFVFPVLSSWSDSFILNEHACCYVEGP